MEDSSGPVGRGKSKMKEIGSNLYKHGRFQSGKLYVKEKHGKRLDLLFSLRNLSFQED